MRDTTLTKTELRQHLTWLVPIAKQALGYYYGATIAHGSTDKMNQVILAQDKLKVIERQLKRDEENTTRRTL